MDSLLEAKIREYLINSMKLNPYHAGTVVTHMRGLARMAGHELNDRFRTAGLGAGPEARVAASIVDRALLGSGAETPDYTVRMHVDDWIRSNPIKGL